jgi:hypothetical protein
MERIGGSSGRSFKEMYMIYEISIEIQIFNFGHLLEEHSIHKEIKISIYTLSYGIILSYSTPFGQDYKK